MSDFFADAGAWFDQAGKDIDQGGQDFGEALQEGAQVVGDALPGVAQVVGDVAQVVSETVQDGAQVVGDVAEVIGDVFNPDNPNPNSVIDQIETNVDQQPTSGYVVDQIESTNNQQSTPDYVVGPDFNNPVPELPSPPVCETFDPLTNPDPILGGDGIDFGGDELVITGDSGDFFNGVEDDVLMLLCGGPEFDCIVLNNELTTSQPFEVADIPMF